MTETLKLIYQAAKVRLGFLIMACALAGIAVSPGDDLAPWRVLVLGLAVLVASASAGADQGLSPNAQRRKEALEEYPLDSLKMNGTLEAGAQIWAIVAAPDGVVHRVKKGNYVGQNNGKVVNVSEQKMEIREIVPDGLGGWRIRESSVALIE